MIVVRPQKFAEHVRQITLGLFQRKPHLAKYRVIYLNISVSIALSCLVFFGVFSAQKFIDDILYSMYFEFECKGCLENFDRRIFIINMWFDGDTPRVFQMMTDRGHYRHSFTGQHPLFSLIAYPPVYLLKNLVGIDLISAVKIVTAAVGSIWISTLFVLLRLIGCRLFEATLFSLLGMISASAMFWLVLPEIFSFGSVTIMLALCLAAVAERHTPAAIWYVAVSALTLSMTVTNWIWGILTTFVSHPWKQSIQITANAFCVVTLLWGVQKALFPAAEFFLANTRTKQLILHQQTNTKASSLSEVVGAFVFHTIIMPDIQVKDVLPRVSLVMTVQHSMPGSASIWGRVAVFSWVALLGMGLWGLICTRQYSQLRVILGLTIGTQLMLHVVFGEETFLYSMHFAPLLITLAAFSTRTRLRVLGLVLAGILIVIGGINNGLQFVKAAEFTRGMGALIDAYLFP